MHGRSETAPHEEKRLNLRLLGPPELSLRGHPLRFGIKKQLALLCYLAAEGGRRPRGELAELLWPGSEERHARGDLRSVLSKLKKALREKSAREGLDEEAHFLLMDGDYLVVEPKELELDTEALEAAVSLARRETSPASSSAAAVGRKELIGRLRGDLGIYRGEFMEGFSIEDAPGFELWVEGERTKWRALFGELCERLSRLEAEEGLIAEAIATARLWARRAPLEEAAHRRLMELLSSVGESERALLVYEGFKNTLGRGLGMEPSRPLQELADRLQEEVEQRASLGADPGARLRGRSCYYWPAFGPGGAAGWAPGGVRGARLRVPGRQHRANARRGDPWGGGDRKDAPGGGVRPMGQSQGSRRPRRRGLGGSGVALRAARGGHKAPRGAREGSRRPLGGRMALRTF